MPAAVRTKRTAPPSLTPAERVMLAEEQRRRAADELALEPRQAPWSVIARLLRADLLLRDLIDRPS